MKQKNNFKCPTTNEEFLIYQYREINGRYLDKFNKELINPINQQKLILIPKKLKGDIKIPMIGEYSSKDAMGKKVILALRSKKDADKNHSPRDYYKD